MGWRYIMQLWDGHQLVLTANDSDPPEQSATDHDPRFTKRLSIVQIEEVA